MNPIRGKEMKKKNRKNVKKNTFRHYDMMNMHAATV